MRKYIAKRLLLAVPTILGAITWFSLPCNWRLAIRP